MDKKQLLQIVQNVSEWRGDVFQLAVQIEQKEKAHNVQILRAGGFDEAADLIEGT